MKVLALSDSLAPWHSFWIRIGQYLPALPWSGNITDNPAAIDKLSAGDRLLVYRYAPGWGDLATRLQRARQRGVVILSDVDDYLWQAQGWSRERLLGFTRALRECEVVTCSTEPLLTQLEVMFPHLKLELLPNSAPQIPKQLSPPAASPLRIGWTGAPWTRPADLALLRPLAQWIGARPNELQLVHIGHVAGRLTLAEAVNLKPAQVEAKPLQGHDSYLQQLNIHIGLAPLSSSSFNHYKSAIKVIEYSALGIPWLASNAGAYRQLCRQWQWAGRLCHDPHHWIDQLQPLLDEQCRQREGETLQNLCIQNASFNSNIDRWRQVLGQS